MRRYALYRVPILVKICFGLQLPRELWGPLAVTLKFPRCSPALTLNVMPFALPHCAHLHSNTKKGPIWEHISASWTSRMPSFFNKYRNTSDVEVQQTRLKLRILETDSEMNRTLARSQLTISRKPSAAWGKEVETDTSTHRQTDVTSAWSRTEGRTRLAALSRRCLRSSWCRNEGLWAALVKALLVPAENQKGEERKKC